MEQIEIRHFHLFCGLGGGAKGFNRGHARVGKLEAKFRCIGGVDVDPAAIRDFQRITGTKGTVLDLFDREQYRAFHGHEPPSDWEEATSADIRNAAGNERPHIVFLSAPCKGFSGLLSESRSKSDKYQALNQLTLRGIWLMLEAWADDPPELIIFENVPRIATRGRALLDRIGELYHAYGYAFAETTHDCGEIGGLAQSRKRFLMVARHVEKVPVFLYQPDKKPLRAVGEVLEKMPMPGDPLGGPMHLMPNLQWKTWVRLAFVEAGSDWRSLNKLAVHDGCLRDYLIVPSHWYAGILGVREWSEPSCTVTGRADPTTGTFAVADPRHKVYAQGYGVTQWTEPNGTVAGESFPSNGKFAVADPRFRDEFEGQQYGVRKWTEPTGVVTSQRSPGQGTFSVADPRFEQVHHNNVFRIVMWNEPSITVTAGHGPSSGAGAVADPRMPEVEYRKKKYKVNRWNENTRAVISASTTGDGAIAVADPRIELTDRGAEGSGPFGIVPWDHPAPTVAASACHDNGRFSVADPRLPVANEKLVAVIQALDKTWHRPFTTLELAALQSLVDPEEMFELDGQSDSAKRERIGNAVPPGAAETIAGVMGQTLLLAWSGERFMLSSQPIWVRPITVALSVKTS